MKGVARMGLLMWSLRILLLALAVHTLWTSLRRPRGSSCPRTRSAPRPHPAVGEEEDIQFEEVE